MGDSVEEFGNRQKAEERGIRVEFGQHLSMILPSIAAVEITTLGFRRVPGSQPCSNAPIPR